MEKNGVDKNILHMNGDISTIEYRPCSNKQMISRDCSLSHKLVKIFSAWHFRMLQHILRIRKAHDDFETFVFYIKN